MLRIQTRLVFLLIALVLYGCSNDGRFKTRGRIVKGGTPFSINEGEGMRIAFVPVEAGETTFETYSAVFSNKDGSFEVVGKDGKGLPPGKYRVLIEHLKKKADLFKGAFNGKNTPFIREVTGSSDQIVLDLDNPQS